MQTYRLVDIRPGTMLLEALIRIKAQDETLAPRRSCGEGVPGQMG
jgi:succinate dehydrogenase / fumarate reductase iron-sulfur subunit